MRNTGFSTIQPGERMTYSQRILTKALSAVFIISIFSFQNFVFGADGQTIFKTYCASCHKPDADYTGPMLKGARDREPSKDWVYKWVPNTTTMIQTDPYAKDLFARFKSVMTPFPNLKKGDVVPNMLCNKKYRFRIHS